MSSNRYTDEMGTDGDEYEKIVRLTPSTVPFREIVACEVANACSGEHTVVDLCSGPGDSAIPILGKTNNITILVDESQNMLGVARSEIVQSCSGDVLDRVTFVRSDMIDFLSGKPDIPGPFTLTSSWAFHNWPAEVRRTAFTAVANFLRKTSSDTFVYMDKVYADGHEKEQRLTLDRQTARYRQYLDQDLAEKIIAHEEADFNIRMAESETLDLLSELGFTAHLADRIERDVVIVCRLKK